MANYSLEYMARVYCEIISSDIAKERILEMAEENISFKVKFETNMNSFLENYFFMRQAEKACNWDEANELEESIIENGRETEKVVAFYAEYSAIKSIKLRFKPEDFC